MTSAVSRSVETHRSPVCVGLLVEEEAHAEDGGQQRGRDDEHGPGRAMRAQGAAVERDRPRGKEEGEQSAPRS